MVLMVLCLEATRTTAKLSVLVQPSQTFIIFITQTRITHTHTHTHTNKYTCIFAQRMLCLKNKKVGGGGGSFIEMTILINLVR